LAVKHSGYAVTGGRKASVVSSHSFFCALKEMDETTARAFLLSAWERVRWYNDEDVMKRTINAAFANN
jgi:hypothetical protein